MRLAIITINFNSSGHTVRLLESLRGQDDKDFDIYVIDNASAKDDVQKLEDYVSRFPGRFVFVKNKENLGFSGGNNAGIAKALQNGSEWVVLLNNDTWADGAVITRLRAILESSSGIIGIPLREGEKTAYCGLIQWLKTTLSHIQDSRFKIQDSRIYVIGGAVVIHKDVFEKAGFWDERYFLYFEDADFSMRARKAGFEISIAGDIFVGHEVSASTKKLGSPLLLRYDWRNAHLFNWKNGPWYIKLALPFWSLWATMKQSVKIIFIPSRREQSRAILSGILDFYRGKFGKIE